MSRWQRVFLVLLAMFFVSAGVAHFVFTSFFLQITPPWLPAPLLLVHISGVAELAGGLGVLLPATRRLAGWGLIALLIAVFPANVYMATSNTQLHDLPAWMSQPSPLARWARLPLQLVFIVWAWWVTQPRKRA